MVVSSTPWVREPGFEGRLPLLVDNAGDEIKVPDTEEEDFPDFKDREEKTLKQEQKPLRKRYHNFVGLEKNLPKPEFHFLKAGRRR